MVETPRMDRRTITVAAVVALAQFMQVLDSAVISIALPPMARDFHVSPVAVGFGITVYVLTASIVIPASAWLADRIGARKLFVLALGAFTLSSLFCGLSGNLPEFIAARALQGIAGALMAPVGQLILLRSVDRSQLLRIMNLSFAPMLLAPVIGPPLGGFLATWLGWPSIFYINVPVGLVVMLLAQRWFPDLKGERRPFDVAGLALNALALTPLLWGLGELGSPGASRIVPAAAVAAGLGFGALALQHARRAAHPLLSLTPLRHPSFRATSGSGTILARLPITATMFVIPLLLQSGFGFSAFLAGLLFLGHGGGDLAMKPFMTATFRRFGYRSVLLVSTAAMSAAIAAAAFFTATTPLYLIAAALFVSGAFRSFVMTGISTLSFAEVEPHEMPSATTLNQVIMQLATALGVSISSVLIEASNQLLGAGSSAPSVGACRVALAVMAAMGAPAMLLFLRLPRHAGAELSGHRAAQIRVAEEAA